MVGSRRIVLSALLAMLPAMPAWAADQGSAPVQGGVAWQQLIGSTVVASTKSGGHYVEFYGSDGAVHHQDVDGSTTGQWSQEGDKTCFDYPDDDERVCVAVVVTGTTGTFTDADGNQDSFAILPGNAKNL